MKPQSIAIAFTSACVLTAHPAFAGRAVGTVDGNAFDLELDCSSWEGEYMSATTTGADVNVHLDVTLFTGQGRLAVTYKPADKRYQLLFPVDGPAEALEVSRTFSNRETGTSYDAQVLVDCTE